METKKTKSMEEKLTEHYEMVQKMGNGGYGTGYYSEIDKKVKSSYQFPNGEFILRKVEGNFFHWHYKPNE